MTDFLVLAVLSTENDYTKNWTSELITYNTVFAAKKAEKKPF